MEEENIPPESDPNNDINLDLDAQQMLKVFTKERGDIIKQKTKHEFSMIIVQETIKVQEEQMKKVLEQQSELELQNKQLKEAAENEIETKLSLENDMEKLKNMTEMFAEQMNQLNNTINFIESKTDNIYESKPQIFLDIAKKLKEYEFEKKLYLEEINKKQALIKTLENDANKEIQEKQLIVAQQKEELILEKETDQQLKIALEEAQNKNSGLEIEKDVKESEKDKLQIKLAEINEVITGLTEKYNYEKINKEVEIKNLETEKEKSQERVLKIKSNLQNLKQENDKIDLEISQVQNKLKQLEFQKCETEDIFEKLKTSLIDITTKLSNERNERNLQIISLEEKEKNATEAQEKLKVRNQELEQQLEEKKQAVELLKQVKLKKYDEKEELIKQIEYAKQKNKNNLLEYEKNIKFYNDKITKLQQKNQHKTEANKEKKKNIEDRLNEISELKTNTQATTEKKIAISKKQDSIFKTMTEDLISLEKENQTLTSQLQEVSKKKELKLAEKNYRDKKQKIEKEIKEFREKMSTKIKNDQDKHIKETRCLEDSVKTSELQINELKCAKENLQEEIASKIKQILDVTNKIETKNNEIQQKEFDNSNTETFKWPVLPAKKRTRETQSTFTTLHSISASTPKTILKKTILKTSVDKSKNQIFPKDSEEVNLSSVDLESENPDDDSNKIIPSIQKPETKTKPTANTVKNKNISQTTEAKKVEPPSLQMTNWKNINVWPTDNETSDEGFNFKNKNLVTSTQKSESEKIKTTEHKKRSVYDFLGSDTDDNDFSNFKSQSKPKILKSKTPLTQGKKSAADFWATDNDSSDDSFFGKLDKSKKIQSDYKETTQPLTTINLDTSLSD